MKKVMFRILGSVLLVTVCFSMSACGFSIKKATSSGVDSGSVQLPNPILEHGTIDEAQKVVGFTFDTPTKLPEGYTQSGITTIAKKIAQVFYKNGESIIAYRVSKESGDISGDYNKYSSEQTITIDKIPVTAKGEKALIRVAYWTKDDISYSITSVHGVSEEQLSKMIQSIYNK